MSDEPTAVPADVERAVRAWHEAVASGDRARTTAAVGDPVVVLGPRGAGAIPPDGFADWVDRSGIALEPVAWHPVSDRLVVVEQDATWPQTPEPLRVATVFRVADGVVTAVLRRPDLDSALELASICRALAETA